CHVCWPAAGTAPLDEPHRLVPGQRGGRELVRLAQGGVGRAGPLPHPRPGPRRRFPLDRLVQPIPAALHPWLPATHRVGTPARRHQPATINHSRITPVSTSWFASDFVSDLRGLITPHPVGPPGPEQEGEDDPTRSPTRSSRTPSQAVPQPNREVRAVAAAGDWGTEPERGRRAVR